MKLKLEDVRVDSFATLDAATVERGTVQGQAASQLIVLTCRATCPGNETCPECPVT
jgi:hypothetical protein